MLQDQNIRDYQESKEETLIGRQKIDYLKGLILIEKEKLIKQNTSQEDLVNAPQIRLSELQQELIKEFENEIKKAFKDQKNLNSYLQQMQREKERLESENQQLEQKIKLLENEVLDGKLDNQTLLEEYKFNHKKLTEALTSEKDRTLHHEKKIQRLEVEIHNNNSKMADIKTRILDLIKEKQMIVKANEEQNQQIKIYEKQIAELNSINEERKSKEKFEERIEELEGECRDLRAECRDLRAECRDLRAECEALQAASAKSDKEIKILQEENRANREKSDKEIKKLSEVIAKLKKEVKRLNESKTDLLEESKSQRTMIKNFRLQDEQNQEKMSKLEEIEFKSWMREIITDLRDDLIKELSGFIDERCYGLSEVDKTANYKGIDMNEVNTCKRNYLLENYGIDTDTFERILEAKYELNYFIHNSTLMEREKVQIYLAGLPDNNELKLIYMSMARFISKREKEELQKQFPNCCRRCGDSGHRTERCQLCYFCGDYGHTQQNCPRRKYNRET